MFDDRVDTGHWNHQTPRLAEEPNEDRDQPREWRQTEFGRTVSLLTLFDAKSEE